DSTNLSRPGQAGSAGSWRRNSWNSTYRAGVSETAVPAWPEPLACTTSSGSTRAWATTRSSSAVRHPRPVTPASVVVITRPVVVAPSAPLGASPLPSLHPSLRPPLRPSLHPSLRPSLDPPHARRHGGVHLV